MPSALLGLTMCTNVHRCCAIPRMHLALQFSKSRYASTQALQQALSRCIQLLKMHSKEKRIEYKYLSEQGLRLQHYAVVDLPPAEALPKPAKGNYRHEQHTRNGAGDPVLRHGAPSHSPGNTQRT
eukprot:2813106-Amphidinium_carterae.1